MQATPKYISKSDDLLTLIHRDDMDALMHRIEWTTLLFFAAMFVTLECLERLRLIHWFSEQTIKLISTSDNEHVQLVFAIVILIWVSRNRSINCKRMLQLSSLLRNNIFLRMFLYILAVGFAVCIDRFNSGHRNDDQNCYCDCGK